MYAEWIFDGIYVAFDTDAWCAHAGNGQEIDSSEVIFSHSLTVSIRHFHGPHLDVFVAITDTCYRLHTAHV